MNAEDLEVSVETKAAEHPEMGVAAVWQAVVDDLDDSELRSALVLVGHPFARKAISNVRPPTQAATRGRSKAEGEPGLPDLAERPAAPSVAARSRWIEASRTYTGLLTTAIHVGDGDQWKPLGNCTTADLDYAGRERAREARVATGQARFLLALRDALERHHAETVADLPDSFDFKALQP